MGLGVRPVGLLEGDAVPPGSGIPVGGGARVGARAHESSLRATRYGAALHLDGPARSGGGPMRSGCVDDLGGPVPDDGHRTLDQAAGRLGCDTQLLAYLAVAPLATIGQAEALLDGVAGTGVQDV